MSGVWRKSYPFAYNRSKTQYTMVPGESGIEGILQGLEAGFSILGKDDCLAVEPGFLHPQACDGIGLSLQLAGPIIAIPGEQARLAVSHSTEQAVPVKFDFMQPPSSVGMRSTNVASCGTIQSGWCAFTAPVTDEKS